MPDGLSFRWSGVQGFKADLAKINRAEERATRRAMVKVSAALRKRVRANTPVRKPDGRQPPPGKTRRNVHTLTPRKIPGGYTGRVSAMRGLQNLYVGALEDRTNFFADAESGFDPKPVFEAEWVKAYKR